MTTALTTTEPAGELANAQPSGLSPPRTLGRLAGALAKAQQKVRAVPHDATNQFHNYQYTSSEAIIEAAKDALAESELAVLPLEETLDGHAKEGVNRYELICKFLLVHSSGESMLLLRHWPVCPDKGRPLDKATAAAATLALSYLLRDLLLMPRVAPGDDVSSREERPPPPPSRPAPPPPRMIDADEVRELHGLVLQSGRTWDQCIGWLRRAAEKRGWTVGGKPSMAELTEPQYLALRKVCESAIAEKARSAAPPPDEPDNAPAPGEVIGRAEVKDIQALMHGANWTWAQCRKSAGAHDEAEINDLTFGEYQALRAALVKAQPAKKGATS